MLGVRFLDVDFMRINLACASSYCMDYMLFLHSRKNERRNGMYRDAMQDRDAWQQACGTKAAAPVRARCAIPPGRGPFRSQTLIQTSSPEIWREKILVVRESACAEVGWPIFGLPP